MGIVLVSRLFCYPCALLCGIGVIGVRGRGVLLGFLGGDTCGCAAFHCSGTLGSGSIEGTQSCWARETVGGGGSSGYMLGLVRDSVSSASEWLLVLGFLCV